MRSIARRTASRTRRPRRRGRPTSGSSRAIRSRRCAARECGRSSSSSTAHRAARRRGRARAQPGGEPARGVDPAVALCQRGAARRDDQLTCPPKSPPSRSNSRTTGYTSRCGPGASISGCASSTLWPGRRAPRPRSRMPRCSASSVRARCGPVGSRNEPSATRSNGGPDPKDGSTTSNEATAGTAPNSPASRAPEPGADTASSPTTSSRSVPPQHDTDTRPTTDRHAPPPLSHRSQVLEVEVAKRKRLRRCRSAGPRGWPNLCHGGRPHGREPPAPRLFT